MESEEIIFSEKIIYFKISWCINRIVVKFIKDCKIMSVKKNFSLLKKSKKNKLFLVFNLLLILLLSMKPSTLMVNATVLYTPTDGLYTNNNSIEFTWSLESLPSIYHIQIANNSDFIDPIVNYDLLTTPYFMIESQEDGTYFWRARAHGIMGWGSFSEVWNFTIDTVPPETPSLVSPIENIFINYSSPYLDWNEASGAYRYNIQIDDDLDMTSPILDITPDTTADNYQVASALADGSYHWRVRAIDKAGNDGSWSSLNNFTIDTILPNVNQPEDIYYDEGDTGYNITWIATDINPETFTVELDSVLIISNTWISSAEIIIFVDGLTPGDHYYTITIYDSAGNVITDTVLVSVSVIVPEISNKITLFILLVLPIAMVLMRLKKKRK